MKTDTFRAQLFNSPDFEIRQIGQLSDESLENLRLLADQHGRKEAAGGEVTRAGVLDQLAQIKAIFAPPPQTTNSQDLDAEAAHVRKLAAAIVWGSK